MVLKLEPQGFLKADYCLNYSPILLYDGQYGIHKDSVQEK